MTPKTPVTGIKTGVRELTVKMPATPWSRGPEGKVVTKIMMQPVSNQNMVQARGGTG